MPTTNESKEWRKLLDPVAKGLIALMAAGAIWLNHSGSESCDVKYSQLDKRLSLAEQNVVNLQSNQDALSGKIDRILESVQTISVDIARMSAVMDNTIIKSKR
jgi:peptidoglycan hydrolase CwlO-like protein